MSLLVSAAVTAATTAVYAKTCARRMNCVTANYAHPAESLAVLGTAALYLVTTTYAGPVWGLVWLAFALLLLGDWENDLRGIRDNWNAPKTGSQRLPMDAANGSLGQLRDHSLA